jgi:hypothetical protein
LSAGVFVEQFFPMKNRSSNTPLLKKTCFSDLKFLVSAWLDCVWLGGVWLNFGGWLWVAGLLSLLGCVRWA